MESSDRAAPRLSPAQVRKRASQVDILLNEAHQDDLLGTPYNENALYGGAGTDRQPLYHLIVMTTGGGNVDVATAPDGQDLVYSFRPNPQEIEMVEPAAADIQALQGGGRHVEHQGDAIGDLSIGGTTGVFQPNLPAPGSPFERHQSRALLGSGVGELDAGIKSANGPGANISPGLGRAWEFQENQDADFQAGAHDERLNTAGTSYRTPAYATTGFDRIVELRAFFRLYLDIKKGKVTTSDITKPEDCFVTWLNLKDGEWWIVEPLLLRVPRGRDFRTGYRYELQLKVLGRMDPANMPFSAGVEARLEGFDASAGGGAGLLERAQSWVAKANAALNEVSALGGSITNLVSTAFGVAQNAIGLINDASDLARDAMDLIGGIAQGSVALVTVPVKDWENLTLFADNFARSLELLGNQLPGAGPGESAPAPSALGAGGALESSMRELARAGKRAVNALRAEGSADSTDPLVASQRRLESARAVDPVLAAAPAARSVTQAIILQGESIRDLSLRVLGDESRWKELVIINDLLPPYISPSGGPGLLQAGDRILIPSSSPAPAASVAPRTGNGRRADLAQRLYGTDLRLVDPARSAGAVTALGAAAFDGGGAHPAERIAHEIEISREVRGGQAVFDFALVRGVPNLVQALYIKASTQPGELRLHPGFGFALPVGTRLTRLSLFLSKFQAYRTITADDRIASLEDLSVRAHGDVLRMKVKATAVGTSAVVGAATPGF
jgi:hypothetical protein